MPKSIVKLKIKSVKNACARLQLLASLKELFENFENMIDL